MSNTQNAINTLSITKSESKEPKKGDEVTNMLFEFFEKVGGI